MSVHKSIRLFTAGLALAVVTFSLSGSAIAADDFPLAGNYTQNVACKGDGTDPAAVKVSISPQEIVSNVGVCTVLDIKKNPDNYFAHVECKFAGGPLMGDITFTPRPDHTVEFVDRDMTYKAILYRCPQ
jgi:hypothetical protein